MPDITAVVYDRTNTSPLTDGALVFADAAAPGGEWPIFDPKARRVLGEPGDGGLAVPLNHPRLAKLNYRNVVRIYQGTDLIKSFVIRDIKDVTDGPPEDRKRIVSGPGLLSRLQEIQRLPPNPINVRPLTYTRRYDWGSRRTSTATWTDTLYAQDRDTLIVGSYRPVAWPTPVAPIETLGIQWIHTVDEDDPHPAGTQYYHREITLDVASEVAGFITAADQFSICLDDVEMLTEKLQGPNSVWWWTWVFGELLPAGTHTLRVKVDVINATGKAGMISAGFKTGTDGIDTTDGYLWASGIGASALPTAGWKAIDNPATKPGQTAGQIMLEGRTEALARGCEYPGVTFTATHDSNGDPFVVIPDFSHKVPATEWDVLEALSPWVEWEIADDGYSLSLYNLDTGVGATTLVELENVTYSSVNGTG